MKRPKPRLAKDPASPLKVVSDPEALGQEALGDSKDDGEPRKAGVHGTTSQAAGREGQCSEHREQGKDEGTPGATGHGCWPMQS